MLNVALSLGGLGMTGYLPRLLTGHDGLRAFSPAAGLWWFLVPVLITVAHRMIPFFSSCVLKPYTVVQPRWTLPLTVVCVTGHLLLELAGIPEWRFLFDAPLAAAGLYHTARWGWRQSFQMRPLAMLHVAFAWLSVGMGLYAVQSLWLLLGGGPILGRAPLHALGIGFIAGMAVAMATRVTLGHSGRVLAAERFTWTCFWGVNLTALLRIAGDTPFGAALNLNLAAGPAWLAFLLPWALRYGPMYLRPRVDGKPG